MGSSIIDRLHECIKIAGSNNALANKAELSEGTIRRILAGGKPTDRTLKTIAQSLSISYDWLATGQGDMKTPPEDFRRFVGAFVKAYESFKDIPEMSVEMVAEKAYEIYISNK